MKKLLLKENILHFPVPWGITKSDQRSLQCQYFSLCFSIAHTPIQTTPVILLHHHPQPVPCGVTKHAIPWPRRLTLNYFYLW